MSDRSRPAQEEPEAEVLSGLRRLSALPDWLAASKDHEQARRVLSRDIPEMADGRIVLQKCKIGHIGYRDGAWHNRCSLKTQTAGEPEAKIIELKGILHPPGSLAVEHALSKGSFGSDGWHGVFPEINLELMALEPETELVAFEVLTDPEKARVFLERCIRNASDAYRDLQLQSCTPQIARYKPGDRCTIVYHLEYAPGSAEQQPAPPVVVAKTTRQQKERNAFTSLSALWNSPFGSDKSVRIAEPIAYDPELKVFIQGPVWEEQTLAELLLSALNAGTPEALAAAGELLQQTAGGLAELHQSGVEVGQVVSWADELAEIEANLLPLYAVFPELALEAGPFLARMRRLEAATAPERFVPSHGTFRPVQVLLHKGEIGFIDFDSFCQSEPARDLSMFSTSLMSISLTPAAKEKDPDPIVTDPAAWEARFQQVAGLREQFLAAYEQRQPVSRQRVALWETINLFYFIVSGWIKAKASEVPLSARLLERFLLERGLTDGSDPLNC